jgi:hypothetical protein
MTALVGFVRRLVSGRGDTATLGIFAPPNLSVE